MVLIADNVIASMRSNMTALIKLPYPHIQNVVIAEVKFYD